MPRIVRTRAFGTIALVALLAARCQDSATNSVARDEVVVERPVATDRSAYRLNDGIVEIAARFANRSQDTVYLSHCGFDFMVLVERLVGSEWQRVIPKYCAAAVLTPPVPVAPGASQRIPIVLRAGPSVTSDELTGTFRLRVYAYPDVENGAEVGLPLSADLTTSATFTVSP